MADDSRTVAAEQRQSVAEHPRPLPVSGDLGADMLTLDVQRAMRDDGLGHAAIAVAATLAAWWAAPGGIDVHAGRGITELAREMGKASASSIRRPVHALKAAGWVTVQRSAERWGVIEGRAQITPTQRWLALLPSEMTLAAPGARLDALVQTFRSSGYPDSETQHHLEARAEFERVLRSLRDLSYGRREELSIVWRKAKYDYGGGGNTASIDTVLRDVSQTGWVQMRNRIHALCYGDGDLAALFDETIATIDGVRELIPTRLLAIVRPERFIPNFVTRSGDPKYPGKLDIIEMLDRLGMLDAPAAEEARTLLKSPGRSSSIGGLVVRSNDMLLKLLRPYFNQDGVVDTWGMARFLYWLAERYADDEELGNDQESDESDDGREHFAEALAEAAEDLLCRAEFLNDIAELLKDKGQVILYGPSGTGKTYFARSLAWALTGMQDDEEYDDDGPYSLVQFHPAYSYEDFFEGFRPTVDDDGNLTYRLTPGPLLKIAELAEANPDRRHVMVIDEINRANLPRVLGELLYLLEYRDEWTQTQYRPAEGFVLPKNLWFIGTMNTADRSIALIDAAMRRRFHFVPFFPNRPPTQGLLRRWTERHAPDQAWVAELLDRVNEELERELGGDHLLIGPSHFMKPDLDEDSVRRIWTYNIEPLIEDQLFGQHDAIERFRFDAILKHLDPDPGVADEAGQPAEMHSGDEGRA